MAPVREFDKLVHSELRSGRFVPTMKAGRLSLALVHHMLEYSSFFSRQPSDVTGDHIHISSLDGGTRLPAYLARPSSAVSKTGRQLIPGILWIHGGGMVVGSYTPDMPRIQALASSNSDCLTSGAIVLSPNYRLAPKATGRTLIDDCYAGWLWMVKNADDLGIDTTRMVVGGGSAGGGLAAATVQRIIDRMEENRGLKPVLQLLVYPMLDDRTVCRHDAGELSLQSHYAGWGPETNRYGWTSYLGHPPSMNTDSPFVPARRVDLSGTPPTWIGVGTLDLFHDEDVEYARRLKAEGIEVQLDVIEGAFHAFEGLCPKAKVSRDFLESQNRFLRTHLERVHA